MYMGLLPLRASLKLISASKLNYQIYKKKKKDKNKYSSEVGSQIWYV